MDQTVLVADDETLVQNLLTRGLSSPGLRVLTADNGALALSRASLENPDLILLDVDMPVKNGWSVLRELRENSRTRMIPVIMLTAKGALDDRVAGLRSGADDYICKPFELDELRARVQSLLRRTRRDQSASPLTRLPGNVAIEEEVNKRLAQGEPFAFCHADIDNFKSYNDFYGYAKGDQVILATAQLLEKGLKLDPEAFLGHVGGDDFVFITSIDAAPHAALALTAAFDLRAPYFYALKDCRRGFIESEDRFGERRRFPFITLSMGIVTTERKTSPSYASLAAAAGEMRRYFKTKPNEGKSRFAFDRRTDF